MDYGIWKVEVERLLHQLEKIDLGYPLGENRLNPPLAARNSISESHGDIAPSCATEIDGFYGICDGLSWPDVNNGYFIKPRAELGLIRNEYDPVEIVGDIPGSIIVVGSSGNGALFAIHPTSGRLLILPSGRIEKNIYIDSTGKVRVQASSFCVFVELLLQDLRAFVTCKQDHLYIG